MATDQMSGDYVTGSMRWVARIMGLLASIPFVLFLADTLAGEPLTLTWTGPQGGPVFIAMALATAGVFVAWRWQMIGGLVTVVGTAAVILLVIAGSGVRVLLPTAILTVPFFIAGLLHLGCCWRLRVQA
jgi:hypothetical protein